jgi:transcription elongation factor GreA
LVWSPVTLPTGADEAGGPPSIKFYELRDNLTPSALSPQRVRGLMLTPDEHAACVEELVRLKHIRERDLPSLLRDARTFVASDAAEEMIQLREDQALVEARIRRLEELLHTAEVIDDDLSTKVVMFGHCVHVEYVRSRRVTAYRIAGIPAGAGTGTVSAGSPLGAALLGRSPGDVVTVELPRGRTERIRILDVIREEPSA